MAVFYATSEIQLNFHSRKGECANTPLSLLFQCSLLKPLYLAKMALILSWASARAFSGVFIPTMAS